MKIAASLLLFSLPVLADGPFLAVGTSTNNGSELVTEGGYQYKDFDFSASYLMAGDVGGGESNDVYIASAVYRYYPGWNFMRGQVFLNGGVAYVNGSQYVSDLNFRIGFGIDWELFEIHLLDHMSNAGLDTPNNGIDIVKLRLNF